MGLAGARFGTVWDAVLAGVDVRAVQLHLARQGGARQGAAWRGKDTSRQGKACVQFKSARDVWILVVYR